MSTRSHYAPLEIMLVEDHEKFADSVKGFLGQIKGVRLVNHASTGSQAIDGYLHYLPHLVLMDISLGNMSGFDVAKHILCTSHPPILVFLSMHDTAPYRDMAKRMGADGFISKSNFATELFPMIDRLIEERLLRQD
jgi:DNA-binding NarL/FixJ family response regulator